MAPFLSRIKKYTLAASLATGIVLSAPCSAAENTNLDASSIFAELAKQKGDSYPLPVLTQKEEENLKAVLKNILVDNSYFSTHTSSEHFSPFATVQHPRATVVSCCDSRVQTNAIDQTPEDDLFVIRNIGNQIKSNEGSVEYGVEHLHTPLLLIVGHVGCGAVKAALSDVTKLSPSIQKELVNLHVSAYKASGGISEEAWLKAVVANVHDQVQMSLEKFASEVKENKLTIIGAVYDFENLLHENYGKLKMININGQRDLKEIERFLKDV